MIRKTTNLGFFINIYHRKQRDHGHRLLDPTRRTLERNNKLTVLGFLNRGAGERERERELCNPLRRQRRERERTGSYKQYIYLYVCVTALEGAVGFLAETDVSVMTELSYGEAKGQSRDTHRELCHV